MDGDQWKALLVRIEGVLVGCCGQFYDRTELSLAKPQPKGLFLSTP